MENPLLSKDDKCDEMPRSKAYYAFRNDNDQSDARQAPVKNFIKNSEDKIEAIYNEVIRMDTMEYVDSHFKDLTCQFKTYGRLNGETIELIWLAPGPQQDHSDKEIKSEKLSGKDPLDFYYHMSGLFIMSDKILRCFEQCNVTNYTATSLVLTNEQKSATWKDYWAVHFFGKVPSLLVVHYDHPLIIEYETGFMFFDQSVKDELDKLSLPYLTFDRRVFKRNRPRSRRMKLTAKENEVVTAIINKSNL